MKYNITKIILLLVLLSTLIGCLVACNQGDMLDGMYKVEFKFNGGSLVTDSSTVTDASTFGYAYEEKGVLILDPVAKFSRPGTTDAIRRDKYVFTGWYKDVGCTIKWDFEKDTLQDDLLILYAGWEKAINHTYSVRYWDEETQQDVVLGTYTLDEDAIATGAKFSDRRNYASGRKGYTSLGEYYQDKDCSVPWDDSFVHPGGEEDVDVPVYVKYLKGEYILVSKFDDLEGAISSTTGSLRNNIYILNSFDCGGEELPYISSLNYEFNGNGKTISNFTVRTYATDRLCMIGNIGAKGQIHDITFADVNYVITAESKTTLSLAVLAQSSTNPNVELKNVHVSGTITNNSENNYDLSVLTGGNNGWISSSSVQVTTSDSDYNITLKQSEE